MVDAAGAIYVIGGYDGGTNTYYNDVWASTDGGARPDSGKGGGRGGTQGGTARVLEEYFGVLQGATGGTRGVRQVRRGY